ncbi:ABC transporter permease [Desulforamulus ruminis]|uniref:Binding-protein-dependent transport systems inner membrane component n=1 Tax=Desulforamulus ruminis (strain ATCC 23193 / DSM 2154 / NCIMB 8452 / DL) TaxID=696281 RepID=F6DK58_DESRL|nr:ABC transporter permease [Desulforamulus ruminis]AEG60372.1 binding-protein-dependent transport systems inner membrane component [Desulforamulus ruminis DSM 2154]
MTTKLQHARELSLPSAFTRYKLRFQKSWYKFSGNKLSVCGLAIVLTVTFIAIFAPYIAPYPQHARELVDYQNAGLAPSAKYLFGTDVIGRDILSRIFFSFRGALLMSVLVIAIAVPIGVFLGLLAGYYKGSRLDTVIMRITDIFLAVPPLILALAICAVLKPNLTNSMLAITIMWWPWYCRLVYGMATSLRNEYFVKAAELIGAGRAHILFREILPNCLSPILTKMALDVGWVILIGASLSFVGLGEQPPTPSLGQMVSDGSRYMPDLWWMTVFPSLAIVLIILGFNFLGDGIRDMLSKGENEYE